MEKEHHDNLAYIRYKKASKAELVQDMKSNNKNFESKNKSKMKTALRK